MDRTELRRRFYFRLLMVLAYIGTIGFGLFYYLLDLDVLFYTTIVSFIFFTVYTLFSLFNRQLILLFRLSIVVIFSAFFMQVYYTGGIASPSVPKFFIAAIVTLFYKPNIDRYIMIGVCFLATISIYLLTIHGYTYDLIPAEMKLLNSFICYTFIMVTFMVYLIMFRDSMMRKNQRLSKSISDLESTTTKLIESEKMESIAMLSSGLAHELNNPLNYVSGLLKPINENLEEVRPLVAEEHKPKAISLIDEVQEFLSVIAIGAEKASFIIKKLIHISPQGDGESVENFDLGETLMMTTQIIKDSHPEVEFDIEIGSNLIINGNQIEVNQLFVNIIENCIEALQLSDSDGVLKITGSNHRDDVLITIQDNGIGMTEDIKRRMFEPFYSNKEPGKGAGLGLYISKSISNKFGGTIQVQSKPNQGAKFNVTFPSIEPN